MKDAVFIFYWCALIGAMFEDMERGGQQDGKIVKEWGVHGEQIKKQYPSDPSKLRATSSDF